MRIENVEDRIQNVEQVLSKMIKTLFPAKLRVFSEDGTRLYQTAVEASRDMKDRGMPVTVIPPRESLAEQLSHSSLGDAGRTEADRGRRGTREEYQGETACLQETSPIHHRRRTISSD
ncbi:CAG pathogenicity island protein 23 [Dissostichus eleginoides]|uniref:CAG pathogenicity island protein 23 n=1 Tax=Dissostichus eleginoides TaxID=100907 RepID=A0AAD9EUX1_DISEL|nr:CAG pathogenicity island protein 23 [Dissostichus eleginoides]